MQHSSESQLSASGRDTSLEGAQRALDEQRWLDAISLASGALAESRPQDPQHPAHLILARALWHQGDLIECCRHALSAENLARQVLDKVCAVNAATLAAFALTELSLDDLALPLAQRALATAQSPDLYRQLPLALSCAAHVYARISDLENSDATHMRALSLAREANDWPALQMAYDNLIVSFVILLRNQELRGDTLGTAAVVGRSRRHVSHIHSLLGNDKLEAWRRGSLMRNLGVLLMLSGELDPAQALLQAALEMTQRLPAAGSDVLAAQTALADLLHRRGQPEVALVHLSDSLSSALFGEAGYRRQLHCLQIAESCLQSLGRTLEARIMSERIRNAMQLHEQMRGGALQILAPLC